MICLFSSLIYLNSKFLIPNKQDDYKIQIKKPKKSEKKIKLLTPKGLNKGVNSPGLLTNIYGMKK